MCNARLIESVEQRMLSRRDLLKGESVGDMTHELHPEFLTYFGEPGFSMKRKFPFAAQGFNLFVLAINEHTGTHIDAPPHFSADGNSVAEIPLSSLVCPLCVVDIREKADEDADARVTPDDLRVWIEADGEIPENACVAMSSGWARHVDGERFRNVEGETMHFPGSHPEVAEMLLESGVAGIAVDTPSLDHGKSPDFAVRYARLPAGRWGIECLAGLDEVPAAGATLVVGAPKHRGGSGGPSRVIASS